MKKRIQLKKKLSLNRETLRLLEKKNLEAAVGGATRPCTLTLCGESGCANTCLC